MRPRLHAGSPWQPGRASYRTPCYSQSKVRAEAAQPRDQLLLVAVGALRLECQGGAPRRDGRRQVNQNGGCAHQPARGAAHEVVVDGAAADAPEAPGPHVAACVE